MEAAKRIQSVGMEAVSLLRSTFLKDAVYVDLHVGREEVSSYTTYTFNDGRIVGIKSLLDAVRITPAHVCVNAAQLELVLLRDFKLMLLSNYFCSKKIF
ncbi:hypothetical protein Tco_0064661 [Tanacetum coccineum]